MADASPNFAVRSFPVQLVINGGTAIVAPIGCSQVILTNTDASGAVSVYSDPALATSPKSLAAGLDYTIRASALCFGPGAVICYVAAPPSQGPVVASFTR